MILISLGLLLMVLGCGSGDGMAAPRTENALGELFSGGTGTSNNNNGGGGGGGTTACVTVNLSTYATTCANGISEANCSATNQIWYEGLSCAQLGF